MTSETTHDMVLTRTFDAPVEAVWRAWTESDLVKRWWGPQGFTAPVADMDVRVGGRSLVCMRAPAEFGGMDFYNTWTYERVEPNERLDFVQRFADSTGASVDPATLGIPGVPLLVPHSVRFVALGPDRTEVTVTESGYASAEVVETSRMGMAQCLDKMAAIFAPDGA